jgi:hypothetical protein
VDRKLEGLAWAHTHLEARGSGDDGVRRVHHRNRSAGGTDSWPSSLTDAQLIDRLPSSVQEALSKIPSKGE